jgi:DNA sulfur modification protein DndD
MLLRKILLENYGLYAGRVELDLLPRIKYGQERPIILVGGKNGTGKTTFLDAIRLVLYGKSILGDRISQKEYEDYLRRQIHRNGNAVFTPDYSRVAIEFDYITAGELKTYFVERSWTARKTNGVKEFLQIKENGKDVGNIDSEYWQSFVEDIIPERLSQLFFFDGEKIASIADNNDESQGLADSIKTLLGLDVVDRLKADLSIYLGREIKKRVGKADNKDWQDYETKINKAKEEIGQILREVAEVRTSIDGVLAEIKNKEDRLRREGNYYATKRDELKRNKIQLAAEIEEQENQIRSECEKSFPFALCPSIANMLRLQLKEEKEWKRISMVRDELASLQEEILSSTKKIDRRSRLQVNDIIRDAFGLRLGKMADGKAKVEIHGLSESSANQILGWIDVSENQAKPAVQKAGKLLLDLQRKLREITKELEKSPDEAQTRPLFEELSKLNQRLGEFQQKEKQIKSRISQKEHELVILQREHQKQIDRKTDKDAVDGRLRCVRTVQKVLGVYHKKLSSQKIEQLRQTVVRCFSQLSRKGDLISDITIEPRNFSITLYDNTGNALPQKSLSAGEKQLFAISMLWGLAKTSGRPLPVIIDTPLGRLDSDHRRNLIENYFPMASHQVILLSTDTEVDQQLFKVLSPDISHCYHLHYNKESRHTEPKEEYFWKEHRKCQN